MDQREEHIRTIPIAQIDINPAFEIRHNWTPEGDDDLPALAESLRGVEGQIYPIIVAPLPQATTFGRLYMLIAGRRRLEAARLHHQPTIQARVLEATSLQEPVSRLRLFAIAVAENVYRKSLTPEERREALRRLKLYYEEVYPPTRQRPLGLGALDEPAPYPSFTAWAAKHFNISRRTISKDLRLAQLAHRQRSAVATVHTANQHPTRLQAAHAAGPRSPESRAEQDPLVTRLQSATTALRELLSLLSQEHQPPLPAAEVADFHRTLEAALALFLHLPGREMSHSAC